MELTDRQKLTIEHLKPSGIESPLDIINYCVNKMDQPKRTNHRHNKHLHVPGRKHSKQYYQEIINYLAQQR